MPPSYSWVADLQALLDDDELVRSDSRVYVDETKTWAAQKNLKPHVLVRPHSVEQLSNVLAYLNDSGLDFGIRSGGVGGGSAKDVLISLSAFDSFAFDEKSETITIGTGQLWGTVDRKLDEQAPGYLALSARCSFVGVGGCIVAAGISWASSEYGLASDPHNLLDGQVVTSNGRVLWASEDPDLLWALRGGGSGFGVVVAVKLRVYKYTNSIYTGNILYPNESLPELAKAISDFTRRTQDPKMAMHLYCLDTAHAALTGQSPAPGIMVVIYDANGEVHGRSEQGFGWALRIKGAVDNTRAMSRTEANQQQDNLRAAFGMTNSWMSGVTIPDLDEDLIFRTWKWFNRLLEKDPKLSAGSFALLEIMQPPAFSSLPKRDAAAWPHTRNRHILQLGTGALPGSEESDALAVKALAEAPYEISLTHTQADYVPNFIEEFNSVEEASIFGENYTKLKKIKQRYDPKGRLGGHFG